MTREELLRHVGSIEQIGGIRDVTFNDGRAKGVRALEICTGPLRFTVLPDRCMDIADASFRGVPFAWMSKAGLVAPTYYEKDDKNWLRSFFGGLVTTCGFKNIGGPFGDQGLHGRLANLPASKVSVFADWVGDEYVMKVSGEMRESAVFGENLVLKRTITTNLFSDSFTLEDTIVNEGFRDEPIALCYHCNFGYPLVSRDSRILNVPEDIAAIPAPTHGQEEACISVPFEDETVTVGIESPELTVSLTYHRDTLPEFLVWKMPGESEYVIGLEPRTTCLGGKNIAANNAYVTLKPFEEYRTYLKFEAKSTKKEN